MEKNKLKSSLLYLGLLGAVFFAACSEQKQSPQIPPQPVNTLIAQASDEPLFFNYPATLTSDEDVFIRPKVSGMISEKLFKAGDFVKKDQVLFIIEQDKFQAASDVARGNLLVARANFTNAEQEHKRNETLIAKQAISQKEYDTSLANFRSARANLEAMQASYKSAQIDLNHSKVSAPFDGIVGDALINVGDYVNASSTELVRVTNLNPIYADFYISDTTKLAFNKNTSNGVWQMDNVEVNIKVNNENFVGKLFFVDSVIDEQSGKVKAKAVFENKENKLIPGIFTTLSSSGFIQKNAFKIPKIAIMQDVRTNYVYTLVDDKVVKTPVSIAFETNEYVLIDTGLKTGDKVITDNFKKIAPGDSVRQADTK